MDFKVILQPLALDDLEAMSHASDSETDMGADHEPFRQAQGPEALEGHEHELENPR